MWVAVISRAAFRKTQTPTPGGGTDPPTPRTSYVCTLTPPPARGGSHPTPYIAAIYFR